MKGGCWHAMSLSAHDPCADRNRLLRIHPCRLYRDGPFVDFTGDKLFQEFRFLVGSTWDTRPLTPHRSLGGVVFATRLESSLGK